MIKEEFQLHYGKFQPGHRSYSILRPGDSRFDKHYVLFRRSLKDWDVRLAAVLEQGFDDCIMVSVFTCTLMFGVFKCVLAVLSYAVVSYFCVVSF